MDALQAIVLGIVQGLTEFLPISSTAHLRIVPAFFGWEDPGAAFTAVVQLGTMLAVLVYFRRELWAIARGWVAGLRDPGLRRTEESRLGWYLILGTAPIAVLGLAFKDTIEHEFRTLELIGVAMVLFSVVLLEAERRGRRRRSLEDFTLRDGVLIGCAQALALVPGVSRSGATISAGLLLDFDRTTAARYSFLLSVPAVVLSGLFELRHVGDGGGASAGATALATLLAFIVGYASIAWLLRWVEHHGIGIFATYRLVVGVLVLSLASTNVIS